MDNETFIYSRAFICVSYVYMRMRNITVNMNHEPWSMILSQPKYCFHIRKWMEYHARQRHFYPSKWHTDQLRSVCMCMCSKLNDAVTGMNACPTIIHFQCTWSSVSQQSALVCIIRLLFACHTKCSCLLAWLFDRHITARAVISSWFFVCERCSRKLGKLKHEQNANESIKIEMTQIVCLFVHPFHANRKNLSKNSLTMTVKLLNSYSLFIQFQIQDMTVDSSGWCIHFTKNFCHRAFPFDLFKCLQFFTWNIFM